MMNLKIVHHHVGARGNVRIPLDDNSPLRQDFELCYYDADEEAITPELEMRLKADGITLLPYCIADGPGRRPFHITRNRFQSSLFPNNPRYGGFVHNLSYGESIQGVDGTIERTIEVETTSLDALCLDDGKVPPPDYLSLDTESCEGLILAGATRVLATSVLWLKAETWFHPVYKGGARVTDVLRIMDDAGFDFVDIEKYEPAAPDRLPITLQGSGFMLGCEVVFARQLEAFDDGPVAELPAPQRVLRLYKLATFAIMNSQIALAVMCLDKARSLGGTFFVEADEQPPTHYLRMLREFEGIVHFFRSRSGNFANFDPVRRAMMTLSEQIRRGGVADEETAKREERERRTAFVRDVESRLGEVLQAHWTESTPLERLLGRYGLRGQASKLRNLRRERCTTFMRELALLKSMRI